MKVSLNKSIPEKRKSRPYTGPGPRPNFTTPPGVRQEVKGVSVSRPDLERKNQDVPNNSVEMSTDINDSNISNIHQYVADIYSMYTEGKFDANVAGSCITGKIRSLFINGLDRGDDTFDIESLKYLDSILFNDMKYIIGTLFFYRYDVRLMRILTNSITNACNTIDYKLTDKNAISELNEIIKSIEIVTL